MTTDRPLPSPPRWAESLLLLLLEPSDRESFSGDLLEEYRETVVPARGRGANRWYAGQVAWFLWRASWMWGVGIGAALIVRYLFDTLVPVTNFVDRSIALSQAIVTIFGAAAFWNTSRTGHIRTGVLVALAAAVIGGVLSSLGSAVLLGIWHDPATLRAWQTSGGVDEALIGVPVLLIPISLVSGAAGALAAKGLWTPIRRLGGRWSPP
jgi:hypothetical protein